MCSNLVRLCVVTWIGYVVTWLGYVVTWIGYVVTWLGKLRTFSNLFYLQVKCSANY